MVFRRRDPQSFAAKVRNLLYPAKGQWRRVRYLVTRVLRLRASPHSVALGVAAGVASSCTPLVGGHIVLAVVLAKIFAGDVLAAALATAVGNPLTFPFIWGATYEIGRVVLGHHAVLGPTPDLMHMLEHVNVVALWPILEPMLVGSVPLAILCGTLSYIATRMGVRLFQKRRSERLALRISAQAELAL
ncbi:DUF2062 domain-containing protein [Rhizobium sp. CFBP 8762]|uniref:DUF2062 domain-containing protein n=1 Tax=Rhizobium sp. CFBP 8762 TaxID=2775279 RepID=UPI00177BCB43|nr:DUF2062 domain-containing protein [Rhizobium sp. CFBP 8762]MBD8553113.1 DUF2062 domain-containing protein [Rhizobium sp. CFBP 8762]